MTSLIKIDIWRNKNRSIFSKIINKHDQINNAFDKIFEECETISFRVDSNDIKWMNKTIDLLDAFVKNKTFSDINYINVCKIKYMIIENICNYATITNNKKILAWVEKKSEPLPLYTME